MNVIRHQDDEGAEPPLVIMIFSRGVERVGADAGLAEMGAAPRSWAQTVTK